MKPVTLWGFNLGISIWAMIIFNSMPFFFGYFVASSLLSLILFVEQLFKRDERRDY